MNEDKASRKEALKVAADALFIAGDIVTDVLIDLPAHWDLPAINENPKFGWCSTKALAQKLKELSEQVEDL